LGKFLREKALSHSISLSLTSYRGGEEEAVAASQVESSTGFLKARKRLLEEKLSRD
jgi:hypothetical protein